MAVKFLRTICCCFIKKSFLKWGSVAVVAMIILLTVTITNAQNGKITRDNIAFISYPDFPEANSTWFDIGYGEKYNKVYVAVTNLHHDEQALYQYDISSQKMRITGLLSRLAHLRNFQWQGKVHSKFVEGPNGNMYFSTDGGEDRQEYLMNHPRGYSGGFFMRWDPFNQKLTNLGMALQYESIKDVDIDNETGVLYGISYPQVHFIVYDVAKNNLRDLGRLGSAHVPRVLFTDWWGNCYYADWRQRLVKYEKDKQELIFAENSLPAFPNTPGSKIITGIMGYAKDKEHNVIYINTYGGKIIAFYPQKEGIGNVKDLGGIFDTQDDKPYVPFAANMGLGNNGKLYYFVGGEGNFVREKVTILMEFDPQTSQKKELIEFPLSEINLVTGSNVKDKEGNLYYAGMKEISQSKNEPFLIIFNPEKKIKK
ncbi:MAG: hypothetical protein ABI288_06740 [Ginsengibacter sp.]